MEIDVAPVNDPTLVAEQSCDRRGTTPRNVTPHQQKRNGVTQSIRDVEDVQYTDDVVETYADEVTKRCNDDEIKCATKRLVNVDMLKDSTDKLACGQCAKDTTGEVEVETMQQFRKFVSKDGENKATMDLIDKFVRSRISNKSRRMAHVEKKSKVQYTEDVVCLSSDIYIQCGSQTTHRYPLTIPTPKNKGQKKVIDRDENKMAILLPFIAGVGPKELETILNMFSLPNCKHYKKTITRWQPLVCEKIIKMSEREMRYAMAEEIKATVIADKGEAYYESWMSKPIDQREKVGLVVSYDMGWQKRASGNSYSSKSGHAFVVGMQTKRIIDCVVFSTNCKKCQYKPVEEKRKKKGEEGGVSTEGDCQAKDTSGLWTSSIPTKLSTLADDGSVAESAIKTTQLDTTTEKYTGPTTPSNRASTNLPPSQPPIVTPTTDVHTQNCKCCPPATPTARTLVFCEPTKETKEQYQPTYKRVVHPLEHGQIVAPEHMSTNVLEPSEGHPSCPCNYDGSPGSMESDGMLWLIKRLHTMMSGCVFYEYIVSDDDTTMKKYLTHPDKRPKGAVNIGGRLPKEIPEPCWFADPTHRAKCVAGKFFKYNKSNSKMTKLDCLRLKKYYSYYIKTNRHKSVEEIKEHIMAPLDHLFNDHQHCDSRWCHKKRNEEDSEKCNEVGSERNKEGYYRCKTEDGELYETLCELYGPYITTERITQCKHEFDTQVNEGMNTCVAKYAPKNKHYSKSVSLEARVKVAAAIYNCGYHFFG